jgi:hypothetical protein
VFCQPMHVFCMKRDGSMSMSISLCTCSTDKEVRHCCPHVRFKATENREWSLRRSCAGRHGVKYQWQCEQTANQKVHAITCSYFCLNIFSVVLCNISVTQQSFLKSKYLVSITGADPGFLVIKIWQYKIIQNDESNEFLL